MSNRGRSRRLLLGILVAVVLPTAAVRAQVDDVFDAPKPEKSEAKKDSGSKESEKVSDRDTIGFTQENVASQMTELEERMFRLSEALRSLEPENASRLRLALKFSREELILQQMKETQALLKEAELGKAETEVRELLAKLEHLRRLLLAEDLDFQLKLARLRQMRETLGQLERIIKEERRELAWSRSAVGQQGHLEAMLGHKTRLESLVKEQKAILQETGRMADEKDNTKDKEARAKVIGHEAAVRKSVEALAAEPESASQSPAYLRQAGPHLEGALTFLKTADIGSALDPEQQALNLFKKELGRLDSGISQVKSEFSEPEFHRFEKDQARNRASADTLGKVSSRLGDSGIALQKALIRAGAEMEQAEGDLARTEAKPASEDQIEALKYLDQSRAGLATAVEKLLVELRIELQARIIAELSEMHEIQASIRETTEAMAPRVAQKSRTALITLAGLSKSEAEMAGRTGQLLALVEETEFGVALPTALRVLSGEMREVKGWLKEGDASTRTVTMEKRIEEDLLGLLQAMRRLPPTTPPPPGSPLPSNLRERERELNRLIAELKMIRLLQSRLNDDTLDVDKTRPKAPTLAPELRQEIEALKSSQEEIRESLSKIGLPLGTPDDGGLVDQ